MKRVAIVYHYLAHYRLPIFQELMKDKIVNYTIISGTTSDTKIKLIPDTYADLNLQDGGLRWFTIKNNWFFNKKFLWQSGLLTKINNEKFDAIIFLGTPYHFTTWIAALLYRLQRRKVYFWMHGYYKDSLNITDVINLYIFYKIANGFFLYGNRARAKLYERHIKPLENMHVIYNSLDYETSKGNRAIVKHIEVLKFREFFFENIEIPTIVFIGRLNKTKRVDYLLEVQKGMLEEGSPYLFNLLIIGEGEEKQNLNNIVEKSKNLVNHVTFLGALYDEKLIGQYIFSSDLCVTPGEVGLTAMHALSYGTPVISHNNFSLQMPEVEAIIPGKTGDLYEYGNIRDLKFVIEKWFDSHPSKSQVVVDSCYEIIDKYYNPKYQRSVFLNALN